MLNSVLVIGGGGREHAIARSLKSSPKVGEVYCLPGNAGMASFAQIVDIDWKDFERVIRFVEEKKIVLTVIGPEAPLVAGLSDALRIKGHMVVGASQNAAQLEGSKIFAKEFMTKFGIPTADYRTFDNAAQAKMFVESRQGRKYRVLKADGLAAGKGVIVAQSTEELSRAITEIMEQKRFGDAGKKILIEEALKGPEVSLMALTDGKTLLPFPSSQDHKRVFDGDHGPNTGGMGAYAPTPFYDETIRVLVDKDIIQNFLRGLSVEKMDFRGIIYFGLMLTKQGPKVLEFNVRFGDPEAEVILPLIKSDMFEVFQAVAQGKLENVRLERWDCFACTVVMASGGYPGQFQTGLPIQGLNDMPKDDHVTVYHCGTKKEGDQILTNGGRVLSVTGVGKTLDSAVVRAYQGVKRITFDRVHFRKDIAGKVLKNKSISRRIKNMRCRAQTPLAASTR
ncbi:MAG: Phosphoribosylamine--glycine ligase [Elusimicrobia bacterium]|nr:Phosphoribosylamine--glycine ligase [Elusimicrobiota bacterium]